MNRRQAGVAAVALLLAHVSLAAEPPVDFERPRLLYENHCLECHRTMVHVRPLREKSRDEVEAQVERWQRNMGLAWNKDDVQSVTRYLSVTYYQFEAVQ